MEHCTEELWEIESRYSKRLLAETKALSFTLTEFKFCVEFDLIHSREKCHAEAQRALRKQMGQLLSSALPAPLRDILWRIDSRLSIADKGLWLLKPITSRCCIRRETFRRNSATFSTPCRSRRQDIPSFSTRKSTKWHCPIRFFPSPRGEFLVAADSSDAHTVGVHFSGQRGHSREGCLKFLTLEPPPTPQDSSCSFSIFSLAGPMWGPQSF